MPASFYKERLLVRAWLIGRIRWRLASLAAPIAFAVIALAASPASAIVVTLPSGKTLSYEAMATPTNGPKPFDDIFSNLDYGGGPIMPSNTNYVIAWEPPGSNAFQNGYLSEIQQFFQDLQSASGTTANSESVAAQYNDATGHVAAYSSSVGSPQYLIDQTALPNGCHVGSNACITDAQIQAELGSYLSAHHLPQDLTHEYFFLTPPNAASCFDAAGTVCSGNVDSTGYCAYHSGGGSATSPLVYANIPDLAGLSGCDPFATHGTGFCPNNVTCHYNQSPADGVLSAISHEQIESLTDPEPNNAWTDFGSNPSTQFGTQPQEIGDKCNNDAMTDPNLHGQSGNNWTPYNYAINGHHYLLQMEWSNSGKACAHSWAPNGTTVQASFTQIASSGDSVSFDASSSAPAVNGTEYVWQWNDSPGQQGSTFTTTSPTTSHNFPAAGSYQVALTVMAPDGTSSGTAHTVYAVNSGPSPAFSPPPAFVGLPALFDASHSSDPNPNGGIGTYSWDFGDGTTGSGKTASHTYSRPGFYTVTLTVQDNYFAIASVSQDVAVSKLRVSFGPTAGLVRKAVHFHAGGPNLPGTKYRWRFGDGRTGHGRTPSHRFRHPGTYKVTLTITFSNGNAQSVTLRVVIRRH